MTYTDTELWKDTHVSDKYEISSHGRARHKESGRILNPRQFFATYKTKDGELKRRSYGMWDYRLGGVTRTIHSLVAHAFIGPRPEGLEVMHLDDDTSNNHYSNLKYATHAENCAMRKRKTA